MTIVARVLSAPAISMALSAWREVAWISLGQAVGALGAIIGVRLLTTVMPPEAYGQFALGMASATVIFQVVLGPLVNAYERFFAPAQESSRTGDFFRVVRVLTARASSIIGCTTVVCAAGFIVFGQSNWAPLVLAVGAYGLFSGWESVLDGVQNAARQRGTVAFHQAVRQWLRPILAVALLAAVASTGVVALIGYTLASALVIGSQLLQFRRTLHRKLDVNAPVAERNEPNLEQQILAYAAPFAIWGTFTWLQGASDRWALEAFRSSTDVGLYAIVFQVGGYPLTLIGAMLTQVAAPIMFAQAGSGSDLRRIRATIQLCASLSIGTLAITLVLCGLGLILHEKVFAILVGDQYRSISPLLPLAVLSSGVFVAGQLLSLLPMAMARSQALLAPKIVTAALAVVLNAAGAYLYGPAGVLWGGLIFGLCYSIWVAFATRALYRARLSTAGAPTAS